MGKEKSIDDNNPVLSCYRKRSLIAQANLEHSTFCKNVFGIGRSTAERRLLRILVRELFKDKLGRLYCFRCEKQILDDHPFDIDHKVSWKTAKDPETMYFDVNNIALSHQSCNRRFTERWGLKGEENSCEKSNSEHKKGEGLHEI